MKKAIIVFFNVLILCISCKPGKDKTTEKDKKFENKDLSISGLHLNSKGNLVFSLKNNLQNNILVNYFNDSINKYIICNERHKVIKGTWTIRIIEIPSRKEELIEKNKTGNFCVHENYAGCDTALVVFPYKIIAAKDTLNGAFFLCVLLKDGSAQSFEPAPYVKEMLNSMDPYPAKNNK
ncbi:MAG: hypothetical protein ACXVNO_05135 [Bacteroidia bacterium]